MASRQEFGRLRRCLALWFAVLLAIGPLAHPPLPGIAAGLPFDSIASAASDDDGLGTPQEPSSGLRAGQSAPLGVLSRLSSVETTLGLPPVKSALLRPSPAAPPLPAPKATSWHGPASDGFLHRSSVGTARTPTGPPL